jgi:hypothetical protein
MRIMEISILVHGEDLLRRESFARDLKAWIGSLFLAAQGRKTGEPASQPGREEGGCDFRLVRYSWLRYVRRCLQLAQPPSGIGDCLPSYAIEQMDD